MIGFYVHVNGTPVALIEAQNINKKWPDKPDYENDIYIYEVKGDGQTIRVEHSRQKGWEALLKTILKKLKDTK